MIFSLWPFYTNLNQSWKNCLIQIINAYQVMKSHDKMRNKRRVNTWADKMRKKGRVYTWVDKLSNEGIIATKCTPEPTLWETRGESPTSTPQSRHIWVIPCQIRHSWKSSSSILTKLGGVINLYEKLKTLKCFFCTTSRGHASGLWNFSLEAA